ncbi:MAG: L-2-amino-thiazoline-4-carboxylic acid hydrolase [Desulfobacterales bacterium]|jgi:hypothetical protein
MSEEGISMIQRRAIEGEMVAAMIEGFSKEIGWENAVRVASDVILELARKSGRDMAYETGDPSLPTLASLIRNIWCRDNALEIRFIEETDSSLHFQVIRCGYAEQYARMGLSELGYCLSCNRDGAFADGFNPDIRLKRSRTLMEGAPLCDFHYTL